MESGESALSHVLAVTEVLSYVSPYACDGSVVELNYCARLAFDLICPRKSAQGGSVDVFYPSSTRVRGTPGAPSPPLLTPFAPKAMTVRAAGTVCQ